VPKSKFSNIPSSYLSGIISKSVPLSKEEQIEISKSLPAQWAREKLVTCNLRFVYKFVIANEFAYIKMDFDDKFMCAVEGLMVGIDKYDIKKDCGVLSYCVWWMRAALQNRALLTPTIRLPECINAHKNTRAYFRRLGLTDKDMVEAGEIKQDELDKLEHAEKLNVSSLNSIPPMSEHGGSYLDVLPDQKAVDPSRNALRGVIKRMIDSSIDCLPEDEQKVFRLRYEEGLNYKQIAERMGFSHETARKKDFKSRAKLCRDPELRHLHATTNEWGGWWSG
jgi:RNA polymerase primary sigma factor